MHAIVSTDFETTNQSKLNWSLMDNQIELVRIRKPTHQLYFALLLKFYEHYHSFFEVFSEIPQRAIKIISKQLDLPPKLLNQSVANRTIERYRAEIRDYFQFRTIGQKDEESIRNWLFDTIFPQ